jgi:AhpD family alkylhydroperoxidase
MKAAFHKRVFTLPQLLRITLQAGIRLPLLGKALIAPATSRKLREQVMLACTSVNDCRYCAWAHTHLALKNGVDIDQLNALLAAPDQPLASEREGIAMLYAQHFAEQLGKPSTEARQRLNSVFSRAEVREIHAYLYAIYFANLSGNTFDALLLRLQGKGAENSNLLTEVISSALSAPVLISIWWAARNDRKVALENLS